MEGESLKSPAWIFSDCPEFLRKKLKEASVANIEIEHSSKAKNQCLYGRFN